MQLAATLLAGAATLAQIAAELGYGSEAAFSRASKKIVGVAPATWRAQRAALPAASRRV
jgi:AraC-like DNA-binding protein